MTPTQALALAVLIVGAPQTLPAQRFFLDGGVNAGTAPRALEPLCGSARRLRGVGVSTRAGVSGRGIRVGAAVDVISRIGVRDAADCVPHSGISVDSTFAPAGNSATTIGVDVWAPVGRWLQAGAEGGVVVRHSSWFVGPALGVQFYRVRVEVAARRHVTAFDEVTREYGTTSVREISRRARTESAWGAVGRVLLMVF